MTVEAVHRALLADAQQERDDQLVEAEREAAATLERARREAEDLLVAARSDGEAEARAAAATELARSRRQARQLVLEARLDAYEGARAEVRAAAAGLRADPGHAALVAALGDLARRQLGPDALVCVDEHDGGLTASNGSRSVDYRLSTMADRCLAEAGDEVEVLWR
jgi:vacuolar-type H+-ATPase subunit E/Vma4